MMILISGKKHITLLWHTTDDLVEDNDDPPNTVNSYILLTFNWQGWEHIMTIQLISLCLAEASSRDTKDIVFPPTF